MRLYSYQSPKAVHHSNTSTLGTRRKMVLLSFLLFPERRGHNPSFHHRSVSRCSGNGLHLGRVWCCGSQASESEVAMVPVDVSSRLRHSAFGAAVVDMVLTRIPCPHRTCCKRIAKKKSAEEQEQTISTSDRTRQLIFERSSPSVLLLPQEHPATFMQPSAKVRIIFAS